MPPAGRKRINWNEHDLTRDAKELAAEIGCDVMAVYSARKRLGITVPKKSGGPRNGFGGKQAGSGRPKAEFPTVNVFASFDSNEVERLDAIAARLGITRSKAIRAAAREFIEREEAKIWAEDR